MRFYVSGGATGLWLLKIAVPDNHQKKQRCHNNQRPVGNNQPFSPGGQGRFGNQGIADKSSPGRGIEGKFKKISGPGLVKAKGHKQGTEKVLAVLGVKYHAGK